MASEDDAHDSQPNEAGQARGDRAREAAAVREAQRKAKAAVKLRENLMRRKTQARARRAGDADETQGLPAAKTDESS